MNKKIWMALLIVALVAVIAGAALLLGFTAKQGGETATTATTEVVTATGSGEAETAPAGEADAAQPLSDEVPVEIVEMTGAITEITDDYVMIDAGEQGEVQVNLSDDTQIMGAEEMTVGQVAVIQYDGKMTRSLPPQITALSIGVNEIKGTVTEIGEGRLTLTKTEGGDEVVLHLPQNAPEIAVGDVITAYTTGVSTMSLPPQMSAVAIVK